jgi:7-cyano-7-deazaguanine synthase in queuosine biosynthesis
MRRHGVLFSGGRDSTLVAVRALENGDTVTLLTFETGLAYGPCLIEHRIAELEARFSDRQILRESLNVVGLVRRIALLEIERDIVQDKYNLVLLGEALALVTEAIVFVKSEDISAISGGYTRYQGQFPEQRPVAIEFFSSLCAEYEVEFTAPLCEISSEETVKEELWLRGLSPKSLERSSLFAESGSTPSDDAVHDYLERKKWIVRSYLKTRVGM